VDETEDSRVGTDAEGENDYGRDGEPWRFEKLAPGELKILDHIQSDASGPRLDSKIARPDEVACGRDPGETQKMELSNIKEATEWFEVLQTSKRSQTAMMTLAPGQATGSKAETHKKSDQVLLMLSGKLSGKIGRKQVRLAKGDVLLIPAGTPHRFNNPGRKKALTFNVYSPPEYTPGTKG
jgi:mannose-6-phosphate isomerase-like protein (cupin superfamily)